MKYDLTIIGAPQYAAVGDYFGATAIIDTNMSTDTLVIFIEKQSTYANRFLSLFDRKLITSRLTKRAEELLSKI